MKYTAILSLGLAALASASIAERDSAPYKKVIDSINSAVDSLDSAVQKYNGDDKKPVIDASDTLIKALDDGKTTIDGLDDLQASDALPLSSSLTSLNTKGQALNDDLKDKRDEVEKAGECDSVRKAIGDINKSAQALVDAAISKVPKGLQSVAQGFVTTFTKSFNETQDYFSTDNCKNGNGGGGGGGGSSSGASSSGTASSTTGPSGTSSQTASSPSGSSGASMFGPTWAVGVALGLFAVY